MIVELCFQMVVAYIACWGFSIIFNAPKRELIFCGISGSVGWAVYYLVNAIFQEPIFATFLAAAVVTTLARFLSYVRRAPSTMYQIVGILPLVPGMQLYNTTQGILNNNMVESYTQGVLALKLAGVIGIGSVLVLALPYSVFELIKITPKNEK